MQRQETHSQLRWIWAVSLPVPGLGLSGSSRVVFWIGGAFGLAQDVLKAADWRLSLSTMTFPHEIARLVLLEQVYRAFTIIRVEGYPK